MIPAGTHQNGKHLLSPSQGCEGEHDEESQPGSPLRYDSGLATPFIAGTPPASSSGKDRGSISTSVCCSCMALVVCFFSARVCGGSCFPFACVSPSFGENRPLKVGPPAPTLFEIPTVGCFEKVPPCADGAVAEMEVYLAHPHQFRYLDNVSPSLCAHQSPVPSHALSILFAIRPAQRPVLPRLRVVSHPRPRLRPVPSPSRPSLNHHSHWVQSPHLSHPSQ